MDLSALKISILGLGGAGGNAVHALKASLGKYDFCQFAALDTDQVSLGRLEGIHRIHLAANLRRGLSCGGSISLGKAALESSKGELASLTQGSDIVLLIGGLGGGLAGGGLQELARLAKESGALVLAFAIMPFTLEGGETTSRANQSLALLRKGVDACIALPNDLLLQGLDKSLTVVDAFREGNQWMERAIGSIVDMLSKPGVINLDLASLQEVFRGRSSANTLFGIGLGPSVDLAVSDLVASPLLHVPGSLKKADSLLINITGGRGLSLAQVHQITQKVSKSFASKDRQIVGAVINDDWDDTIQIVIMGVSASASAGSRSKSMDGAAPYQPALFDDWVEPKKTGTKRSQRNSETAQRGYFIETELNLYAGEDLDVPTYLRKGITPKF